MNWTKIVRKGLLPLIPLTLILSGCGRMGGGQRAGGFGGQQRAGGQQGFGGLQGFGGQQGIGRGQNFGGNVQGNQMGNFGLDERLAGIRRVNDAQTADIRNINDRLTRVEGQLTPRQPAVTPRPVTPAPVTFPPATPPTDEPPVVRPSLPNYAPDDPPPLPPGEVRV